MLVRTLATSLKMGLGEGLRLSLLFPALSLYTPLEVRGLENLQGAKSFIFAANHSSHLDAPLVLAALPSRLRLQTRVVAASDYFFNSWWKGAIVSILLNAVPFTRHGAAAASSVREMQQILNQGCNLLIFPEGTRTTSGSLHSFKRGVGKLTISTGAAVVPVWIEGTYLAMPKGARWPHHQAVTITFGQSLKFAPTTDALVVAQTIEQQVRILAGRSEVVASHTTAA